MDEPADQIWAVLNHILIVHLVTDYTFFFQKLRFHLAMKLLGQRIDYTFNW